MKKHSEDEESAERITVEDIVDRLNKVCTPKPKVKPLAWSDKIHIGDRWEMHVKSQNRVIPMYIKGSHTCPSVWVHMYGQLLVPHDSQEAALEAAQKVYEQIILGCLE